MLTVTSTTYCGSGLLPADLDLILNRDHSRNALSVDFRFVALTSSGHDPDERHATMGNRDRDPFDVVFAEGAGDVLRDAGIIERRCPGKRAGHGQQQCSNQPSHDALVAKRS